jgi:hypothetical protein
MELTMQEYKKVTMVEEQAHLNAGQPRKLRQWSDHHCTLHRICCVQYSRTRNSDS